MSSWESPTPVCRECTDVTVSTNEPPPPREGGSFVSWAQCGSMAAMTAVVFYRNVNLGHTGSPRREQLEAALAAAGAERVRSFQTNGTVLLRAQDPAATVEPRPCR